MAGTDKGGVQTMNQVEREAILKETISKEERYYKLYTTYQPNRKKMTYLTPKPNTNPDKDEEEDVSYHEALEKKSAPPNTKFPFPQTTAQEIGWDTNPLVQPKRNDARFHHPRNRSDITKYMDAAWLHKEASTHH
eukprot:Colp12_sorted_trinity150504_noHs@2638